MKITRKQEDFALAYCRLENASDAYREVYRPKKANSKTINEAASRLLKNSKVAAIISEIMKKSAETVGLTVERTLREIARLSYSDVRKLFDDQGELRPIHTLDDDTAATVASVEQLEEFGQGDDGARKLTGYTKKLKVWDKNAALEKAMKYLGLYEKDNLQKPQVVIVATPLDERV